MQHTPPLSVLGAHDFNLVTIADSFDYLDPDSFSLINRSHERMAAKKKKDKGKHGGHSHGHHEKKGADKNSNKPKTLAIVALQAGKYGKETKKVGKKTFDVNIYPDAFFSRFLDIANPYINR
jgi:hypothetical protein